jgi:hypothetical protein
MFLQTDPDKRASLEDIKESEFLNIKNIYHRQSSKILQDGIELTKCKGYDDINSPPP